MNVRVQKGVEIGGQLCYLCGRMLGRIHHTTGMDEVTDFQVCGGVYSNIEHPTVLRQLSFIPWAVPMPTIHANGTFEIDYYVQVGTDIAQIIHDAGKARPSKCLATFEYNLCLRRKHGFVYKAVPLGDIYATDEHRQFIMRLWSLPYIIAEVNPTGVATPAAIWKASVPRSAMAAQRAKNAAAVQSNRRILRAGLR